MMKIIKLLVSIFVCGLFLTMAYAGDGVTPMPVEGQSLSSSGWFNITWGDGRKGTTETFYTLTDDSGQITNLFIDETLSRSVGGVFWFNRKQVSVAGIYATARFANGATTGLNVTSIALAPSQETGALSGDVSPAVTGSKPWVTIMCRFSDIADEPENLAYFINMYSNTNPRLDHYWRELSYDTANVAGSTAAGWFLLPEAEAHYEHTSGAGLDHLANDCTAAADASVDFSLYDGINMMFNFDWYNGYAWGGSQKFTLDKVTKTWSITWEPPWAYADISVIQHEMGHGFGLPHSSGAYGETYDNAWDVMSDDRYNCTAAEDLTYGCVGQHTIAHHKDILGWIPAEQKFTALVGNSTTITLEQLALPATANYKMAQIPIGGSSKKFYTVEARRLTGYDIKLAGAAVIIHEVDTTRERHAYVVDPDLNGETGDAGAMWVAGETFVDATNKISVRVDSATASGFQVTIANDASVSLASMSGTVRSGSATGTVLSGATVSIAGKTQTTSSTGTFTITAIPTGTYTLTISKTGYTTYTNAAYAISANQTGLTFYLPQSSKPSAPSNVSASDGTYTWMVYITWSSVSGATKYNVYRATSSTGTKSKLGYVTGTAASDTTATAGTTYYYWVTAVNSVGESGYSSSNRGYRKASAYSMSGTVRSDSATGTVLSGVTVSIAGKTQTTSSTGTFSITAIPTGTYTLTISKTGYTTYTNAAYAISANQTGLTFYLTQLSKPSAPSSVSASDGTYTWMVYITWSSVSGATKYNVYRATSSTGTKSKLGSATTTNYSDTTATAGRTYYYWVTAVNSGGESGYSSYDSGYKKK